MLRLASMLYLLIAPTLAGSLIVVGLVVRSLNLYTLEGIGLLAGIGFVAGVPLAFVLAAYMRKNT